MAKKKTNGKRIPVEHYEHPKQQRTNIPTTELASFVTEEQAKPQPVAFEGLLYARDPSLDPQLVWQGKDQQDREKLTVPAVPIHIHEHIQPHALIEAFRERYHREKEKGQPPADLFAAFNGEEDFAKKLDFYQHPKQWANRLILGDSLHVMTSLAEKENLKGRVQMVFMDPPYGIKFGSNWQVSTRKRDVKDGKADDLTRQPEQIKAFRDTWEHGIHSYLPQLRDRFVVARELLSENGSIFVQIGEENVHLVRCLMDEVFGSENQCSFITFKKTSGAGSFSGGTNLLASVTDYLLWYSKDKENLKYRQLYRSKEVGGAGAGAYSLVETEIGERRRIRPEERESGLFPGRLFRGDNITSQTVREAQTTVFPVELEGKTFMPGRGGWKTNKEGMQRLRLIRRVIGLGNTLSYVRYLDDFPAFPFNNVWEDTTTAGFADPKVYVVQTNIKVVERCLLMATEPGDLVVDPTCGSGTTAYVAEQWGRRWITIDTSRVALTIARTRLMAAKYPYYLLADSQEGVRKEAELAGRMPPDVKTESDVNKGFVYKRVPHVTLKSIANNEEIDAIHAKWQAKLEPLRLSLNKLLKQTWEEWQLPREPDEKCSAKAKEQLSQWWQLRQQRQKEIDASIAKRAETELLYDQPYEDKERIRVSGPFTVESLSPHRAIAPDLERPASEKHGQDSNGQSFTTIILENLRKAGVQNTKQGERLVFDNLQPFAGEWVHAAGEYTDAEGKTRRAAVSIGPEYGTVGKDMLREAAKEAMKGIGFDLLLLCGFAFDPLVSEESRHYGKLRVLTTRMNADLVMGDDLLKKTGAANLFMVFGEPDIDIERQDGKLIVEIKGLDIYDPTTGQVRSNSTDEIACWFLDTDYNEEAFFVRHAYFTGADEPYEKLKRALRAEIDEAAWSALYTTRSYPFNPPKKSKIAVKVINHYGDEVLKVYDVKR